MVSTADYVKLEKFLLSRIVKIWDFEFVLDRSGVGGGRALYTDNNKNPSRFSENILARICSPTLYNKLKCSCEISSDSVVQNL